MKILFTSCALACLFFLNAVLAQDLPEVYTDSASAGDEINIFSIFDEESYAPEDITLNELKNLARNPELINEQKIIQLLSPYENINSLPNHKAILLEITKITLLFRYTMHDLLSFLKDRKADFSQPLIGEKTALDFYLEKGPLIHKVRFSQIRELHRTTLPDDVQQHRTANYIINNIMTQSNSSVVKERELKKYAEHGVKFPLASSLHGVIFYLEKSLESSEQLSYPHTAVYLLENVYTKELKNTPQRGHITPDIATTLLGHISRYIDRQQTCSPASSSLSKWLEWLHNKGARQEYTYTGGTAATECITTYDGDS